jgi:single-stranded DNA-binding protein
MFNAVILEGRLAENPRVNVNSDGSKGVMITLIHDTGRKNKEGKSITSRINVRAFIRAGVESVTPYEMCHEGDLIGVQGEVRCDAPYMKDGVTVYPSQYILAQKMEFKESKSVTDARRAKKVAEAAAAHAEEESEDAPF